MKLVNGRYVPTIAGELNNQETMDNLASLLTEMSNALSETVDGDALALASLSTTGAATVGTTLLVTGVATLSGGVASITVPKTGTIVLGASSSASGSGFVLSASATAALKVYADDGGVLYGAAAVRSAVFRNLITLSHSNETSIFGSQSQVKIKPVLDTVLTTGNRAGSWNYLEMAGTSAKTITLSGASKATAGAFCMVDWDGVGTLVISANHVLAGCAVLTNVTKGAGTFTQTGTFAGFATLNNAAASYSPFAVGLYIGPDSVDQILVAGTSSAKTTCDTADTKFVQIYADCGATSGSARGIYDRLYVTGAGGSGDALRAYCTVLDVTAVDARGAHISLDFGSTGKVSGSGQALTTTLHIANQATQSGTMSAITAEIYSEGSTSDPSGARLSFIRFAANGDTTGDDDVETDAAIFDFHGLTVGDGNIIAVDGSPAAMGNVTYTARCRMPDGTLAYLNFTAAPVTA